jgi:molybdate transport system regulatory protein
MKKTILHRFWITGENGFMLGQGRITLLEAIVREGSINKAAKSLNLSYKKAWKQINAMNDASDKPIVVRSSGGVGGGGTVVTPEGLKLIDVYRNMQKKAQAYFEKESENLDL